MQQPISSTNGEPLHNSGFSLLDHHVGKIKNEMILNYSCGGGAPINQQLYAMNNGGGGHKRKTESALIDDEDDSDEDDDYAAAASGGEGLSPPGNSGMHNAAENSPRIKSLPANGKKTKGRVKIKMEFIDNKLRRYTTFSKRKTGIMKKAYELSTLTGTQVMLLVASETGHVYTFATRKLQPMITSEAGKALIQTCLNSPDPLGLNGGGLGGPGGPGGAGAGGPGGSSVPDQRMSATGFEEVDLTYTVADDAENKEALSLCQAYYLGGRGGGVTSPSDEGSSSGSPSPPPPSSSTSTSGLNNGTSGGPAGPATLVGSLRLTTNNLNSSSSSTTQHHQLINHNNTSANTSSSSTVHFGTKSLVTTAPSTITNKTLATHIPTTAFTTILTGTSLSSALHQLGSGGQSVVTSLASGGQTVYRLSTGNLLSIPSSGPLGSSSSSSAAGGPTMATLAGPGVVGGAAGGGGLSNLLATHHPPHPNLHSLPPHTSTQNISLLSVLPSSGGVLGGVSSSPGGLPNPLGSGVGSVVAGGGGTVVYQTAQGLVYATHVVPSMPPPANTSNSTSISTSISSSPSTTISDSGGGGGGVILNLGPQDGGTQFITIPVSSLTHHHHHQSSHLSSHQSHHQQQQHQKQLVVQASSSSSVATPTSHKRSNKHHKSSA